QGSDQWTRQPRSTDVLNCGASNLPDGCHDVVVCQTRQTQMISVGGKKTAGRNAMLGWFGELNAKERRTMGACFGGWALDAFDVQMYSFVIPTVIALWGLSRGEAGLIGT